MIEAAAQDAVALLFRHVVQQRLLELFPRGHRLLDLGCGAGEDALVLAAQGRRVHGIDPSPARIETARTRAAARGLDALATFAVGRAGEAPAVPDTLDGAYVRFGALDGADHAGVGASLAALLPSQAPVLVSLPGPSPLPAVLRRALTGEGERRSGPLSLGALRVAFGPRFEWMRAFSLGLLVPSPGGRWVHEHPEAFAVLAAAERTVRAWPLLRGWGDHIVLEGRAR